MSKQSVAQNDGLTPPVEEFDFSKDSAVDIFTGIWTVTEVESKETNSDKGEGVQHILTFENPEFPYPVTVRQFVQYTSKEGKDTSWVNRSRGQLKNIAKAASERKGDKLSEGKYSLTPGAENYIVGKRVLATTKDNGDGFATLSKFKPVKESNGGF